MYFITTLIGKDTLKKHPYYKTTNCRCFGYFKLLTDAINAVEKNMGSMQECLYTYLVIEEMEQGVHPISTLELWYKWEDGKWVSCERPEEFLGTINFSIG